MTFSSGAASRDAALVRRFGGPVRYTDEHGTTSTVLGVFENPKRRSNIGPRSMSATFPMLTMLRSEVPNLKKGELLAVDGCEYRVKVPEYDESEIVVARLEVLPQ